MASLHKRGIAYTIKVKSKVTGRPGYIGIRQQTKRAAEEILGHIRRIESAAHGSTSLEPATASWLQGVSDTLHNRIAAQGLTEPRIKAAVERYDVGDFCAWCVEQKKPSLKPGTVGRMQQAVAAAREHFSGRYLDELTEDDAEAFWDYCKGRGLAEATCRKRCADLKRWLSRAVRMGRMASNPFANTDVVKTTAIGTKNHAFITSEDAHAILAELPTLESKLVFAMARWGGVRIKSEISGLTFADIHWHEDQAQQRITIRSPKTEHHDGGDSRQLPLWPELESLLRESLEQAEPGQVYVLPGVRDKSAAALRKPIIRAAGRAGVKQWPRLFHNLRSSRQTELAQIAPLPEVCRWMGNSLRVAEQSYLQSTTETWSAAVAKVRQAGCAQPVAQLLLSKSTQNEAKRSKAVKPKKAKNDGKTAINENGPASLPAQKRPLRDLNPCYQDENLASWTRLDEGVGWVTPDQGF